jgi:hypothetical protein
VPVCCMLCWAFAFPHTSQVTVTATLPVSVDLRQTICWLCFLSMSPMQQHVPSDVSWACTGYNRFSLLPGAVQVCGLKLVESQLLASLAAAAASSDAATLRAQRLAAALEATAAAGAASIPVGDATHSTPPPAAAGTAAGSEGSSGSSLAVELAGLQAQLLARDQEVFCLQDQLRQAQQLAAARQLEGAALQAQLSEACSASSAAQASDAAALAAQRAALTAAAAAEEARLRRELQVCRRMIGSHLEAESGCVEYLWLATCRVRQFSQRCLLCSAASGSHQHLETAGVIDTCTNTRSFPSKCRSCASSCSSRAAPRQQPWKLSGPQPPSRRTSRLQQQPSLQRRQQQLRCMLLRCVQHCWRVSWR